MHDFVLVIPAAAGHCQRHIPRTYTHTPLNHRVDQNGADLPMWPLMRGYMSCPCPPFEEDEAPWRRSLFRPPREGGYVDVKPQASMFPGYRACSILVEPDANHDSKLWLHIPHP